VIECDPDNKKKWYLVFGFWNLEPGIWNLEFEV
jgi:hypothetical protein